MTLNMTSPLVSVAPSADPWVPLNGDWQAIGGDFSAAAEEIEAGNGHGNGRSRELVG